MSWNNPIETEFCVSKVRTKRLLCKECGKVIAQGTEAIFVLSEKHVFMGAYHDGCHPEKSIEDIEDDSADSLHFMNVEDGMIG